MNKRIILNATILVITIISMGFFDKLFGQTNTGQQPLQKAEHEEDWEFYFTNVDGQFGSIIVDLGLRKKAPLKDKTNVAWVRVKMNKPGQNGLSSDEESEFLAGIEDALVREITRKHKAIYVGRLTSAGDRDFYFYMGDTSQYNKTISTVMATYPKYKFDSGSKEDKTWAGYLDFLYPSPQQYQSIQNRRVIDQLEKSGDKLIKKREVFHWIYFKSEGDRENFLEKIKNDNFSTVNKDQDQSLGAFSYRLKIKRLDKVDHESVDEYVIYLWNLANKSNGDYDGWETTIEKD